MIRLATNVVRWSLGLALGLIVCMPHPGQAATRTGIFTLSPSSGTYTKGSTFTVAIKEDSGTIAVNAVQAGLTYNPLHLELLSIDTASSAFNIRAVEMGGQGKLRIVRAKLPSPLTGNQLVGSATFKVLASTGATALSFDSASAIEQANPNQNIWNGALAGGNFSLRPGGQATHSTTGDRKKASSYLLAIKVLTRDNKPVSGAKVTVSNTTATTDSTGVASFYDVPSGAHPVATTAHGQARASSFVINPRSELVLHRHTVRLATKRYSPDLVWYAALCVEVLLFSFIWASHRRRK